MRTVFLTKELNSPQGEYKYLGGGQKAAAD